LLHLCMLASRRCRGMPEFWGLAAYWLVLIPVLLIWPVGRERPGFATAVALGCAVLLPVLTYLRLLRSSAARRGYAASPLRRTGDE